MGQRRRRTGIGQSRLGAHLSIAGGVHHALEAANALGCDCLQIFVKNQRQWSASPLDPAEIDRWAERWGRLGIWPVYAHATYLINLASPNPTIWRRSIVGCIDELRRCALLRIPGLIVHPGSHKGAGLRTGIGRIVEAIDRACADTDGSDVRIVLETTAGQGYGIGSRFEHLAEILSKVRRPDRLGICFDTCHVFAAGYELRSLEGYEQTLADFDRYIGLRRICCIHVNDSKGKRGSCLDRHEHIGQGKLGLDAFRLLVNDRRLASIPKILETPKGQDARGRDLDTINLATLRRLTLMAPVRSEPAGPSRGRTIG